MHQSTGAIALRERCMMYKSGVHYYSKLLGKKPSETADIPGDRVKNGRLVMETEPTFPSFRPLSNLQERPSRHPICPLRKFMPDSDGGVLAKHLADLHADVEVPRFR